ncbi:MAG: DUF2934 domain-containing protein [Candidatus Binataceae bacterium]
MATEIRRKKMATEKNPQQEHASPRNGLEPAEDEIRTRAHEIYLARNGEPGNEVDDWLTAEAELKAGLD